ncbi:MAG: TIGR00730 family Rossman fold protein [Chloroflexota bacterium]
MESGIISYMSIPKKTKKTEDEQLLSAPAAPVSGTTSEAWRVFRIMGEFVEGFESLSDIPPAVTVFGSARDREADGNGWYEKAVGLTRHLGEAGFAIITGGGPGIMEAANRGAREAEAYSVGLNIELPFEQFINPYVDLSIDFRYFFTRKVMLVKYAKAFVVMPGGFGTMDELFEALTLIQTGKIRNFPIVLFGTEYWGGLIEWLRNTMLANGKISAEDLDLILLTDSAEEACAHIVKCTTDQNSREALEESVRNVTRNAVARNLK